MKQKQPNMVSVRCYNQYEDVIVQSQELPNDQSSNCDIITLIIWWLHNHDVH